MVKMPEAAFNEREENLRRIREIDERLRILRGDKENLHDKPGEPVYLSGDEQRNAEEISGLEIERAKKLEK